MNAKSADRTSNQTRNALRKWLSPPPHVAFGAPENVWFSTKRNNINFSPMILTFGQIYNKLLKSKL